METIHSIEITPDSSSMRAWVRLSLTIVGIVTAAICLFTLLSEVHSTPNIATVSHIIEVSRIIAGDFSATSVSVVSAMWPL